jgi:hypothetical protein
MSATNTHPSMLVQMVPGVPRLPCLKPVLLHLGEIHCPVPYHSYDQDDDSGAKPGIRIWRSKRVCNAPANERGQPDSPHPYKEAVSGDRLWRLTFRFKRSGVACLSCRCRQADADVASGSTHGRARPNLLRREAKHLDGVNIRGPALSALRNCQGRAHQVRHQDYSSSGMRSRHVADLLKRGPRDTLPGVAA